MVTVKLDSDLADAVEDNGILQSDAILIQLARNQEALGKLLRQLGERTAAAKSSIEIVRRDRKQRD